jgi:hypothetical protein
MLRARAASSHRSGHPDRPARLPASPEQLRGGHRHAPRRSGHGCAAPRRFARTGSGPVPDRAGRRPPGATLGPSPLRGRAARLPVRGRSSGTHHRPARTFIAQPPRRHHNGQAAHRDLTTTIAALDRRVDAGGLPELTSSGKHVHSSGKHVHNQRSRLTADDADLARTLTALHDLDRCLISIRAGAQSSRRAGRGRGDLLSSGPAASLAPGGVNGDHPIEVIPATPAGLLASPYMLDGCGPLDPATGSPRCRLKSTGAQTPASVRNSEWLARPRSMLGAPGPLQN